MFSIFKRKPDPASESDYEEISEKKTTKLGYILLILMSIFLISISQTVFSDLKSIPDRPLPPAYCIENLKDERYKELSYEQNCRFSDIDERFSLHSQYVAIELELDAIVSINQQINQLESTIRTNDNSIFRYEREYELSLQEKLTEEEILFDVDVIQSQITRLRNENIALRQQIASLETEINQIGSKINTQVDEILSSYSDAKEYHKKASASYKFKVFGLMVLFVLPFFAVSMSYYLRFKRRNSPYTIIFTALVTSASILLLQIVGIFLYDVILAKWIAYLFTIFLSVPIFRYILYYGSVLITILIFGGIVYFIQKKVFDPKRVAIRRLKDNKCPNCSFSINRREEHCPSCGILLKEKCEHCGILRFVYLPYCPACGKKKTGASVEKHQ